MACHSDGVQHSAALQMLSAQVSCIPSHPSTRFATVEREFLLLLQCCSNKQQIKRFDEAAVGLAEAQKTMPVLPMHSLSKLKDEEGGTLFDAITLVAKRTQADETHVAMVKLAKLPDDR